MKQGLSSIEIKRRNRNAVFRFINAKEKTSIPTIASSLKLSVPTALQMVNELKQLGYVEEVGEFASTGGRKAKAIATVKSVCYAVGIDITKNHIGIMLTDLSQKAIHHMRIRKSFQNNAGYFREIDIILADFLKMHNIAKEKVAGVGIAVPAIVNSAQKRISFSHALGIQDLSIEQYLSVMSYPCTLLNDANAAAVTEYIHINERKNLVYLSLSNTVGGAIVMKKNTEDDLFAGDNWRSGEFGHMMIHPKGRACYCGKCGCLDSYCSAAVLTQHTDGDLQQFFKELEQGNKVYQKIWKTYLEDLAIAVDSIRMSFDTDVILGGYVGSYMKPYLKELQEIVASENIFGNDGEYVKTCSYLVEEASALGAAMHQMEKYISQI